MSISKKIRKQLEQPDGLTQEKLEPLAAEYAMQVAQVNQRLNECLSYLNRGLRSEALQRANIKPNVLDLASELNFPELEEWIEILQFYGIELPELIDRDAIEQLNEAFVDEQPLEELLKQHRRMAIAKAPLAWRLKTLRQIAEIDSLNNVWIDDIKVWEIARLKEIDRDWSRLLGPDVPLEELQKLSMELEADKWIQQPPAAMKQKLAQEIDRRFHATKLDELRSIARQFYQAFVAGDLHQAEAQADLWTSTLGQLKEPPPPDLIEEVAPAWEWVEERRRERALEAKHAELSDQLGMLLEKANIKEGELQNAYHAIVALQLGIDPLLENRFETRIQEIQHADRRRLTLMLSSIISVTLILMISAGLWYWNYNYRMALKSTVDRLTTLIDSENYTEATSFLTTVSSQAASIANSPEVAAIQARLTSKIEEESNRHQAFLELLGLADSEQPEGLDIVKIVAAERAAKTPEEKGAVAQIRSRYDRYEQSLVNQQFQALRDDLQKMEMRLEEIQNGAISASSEEELERVLVDLKELPSRYPKAASPGGKLVDLTRQRTVSLRDSLRRQLRESELRRIGLNSLRNASGIVDYERQLQNYINNLPDDSTSLEFKEVLKEKELWHILEEWNAWCADLALKNSGNLEREKASTMLTRFHNYTTVIDRLPASESRISYQEKYSLQNAQEGILRTLAEGLSESIFMETSTLRSSTDKRVFISFDTIPDIASAINRTTNVSLSTIPIISDAQGSLSNQTLRGKLTIADNPRQLIRILVKSLETSPETILADWESQMFKLMKGIIAQKDLDGKIKEILLARFAKAASEGSAVMKKILLPVQEEIFRTSDARNRWYVEADWNEDISEELRILLQKAEMQMAKVLQEEAKQLQLLSRARVVFVGGLLREESGKLSISLYRPDVPDGTLWIVTPRGVDDGRGQLIQIGTVQEHFGKLDTSPSNWSAGRPVYWIRKIPNS
jgi:hypothetical protein